MYSFSVPPLNVTHLASFSKTIKFPPDSKAKMGGGHQGEYGPEYLLVPTSDPALIPVTREGKEKHILEVRDGTLALSKFQSDKRSNPDERANLCSL